MPWSMSARYVKQKKQLCVFIYIKYGKFWSVSLELFVEHKLWNWEEWYVSFSFLMIPSDPLIHGLNHVLNAIRRMMNFIHFANILQFCNCTTGCSIGIWDISYPDYGKARKHFNNFKGAVLHDSSVHLFFSHFFFNLGSMNFHLKS